eukprot:1583359-Prymnesium_polylepis.1
MAGADAIAARADAALEAAEADSAAWESGWRERLAAADAQVADAEATAAAQVEGMVAGADGAEGGDAECGDGLSESEATLEDARGALRAVAEALRAQRERLMSGELEAPSSWAAAVEGAQRAVSYTHLRAHETLMNL